MQSEHGLNTCLLESQLINDYQITGFLWNVHFHLQLERISMRTTLAALEPRGHSAFAAIPSQNAWQKQLKGGKTYLVQFQGLAVHHVDGGMGGRNGSIHGGGSLYHDSVPSWWISNQRAQEAPEVGVTFKTHSQEAHFDDLSHRISQTFRAVPAPGHQLFKCRSWMIPGGGRFRLKHIGVAY